MMPSDVARPKAEVARIFGVGISSVKGYIKMAEERGLLDSKKAPGKKRKLDENGRKLREEDLRARPTATYEQRIEFLDALLGVRVSKSITCRAASAWATLGKRSAA